MPTPEIPIVTERPENPVISESLQQSGVSATPTNVKPVVNDKGQPMISTGSPGSAKIQLPSDQTTLLAQAKGSVGNAVTWLAKVLMRLIAKQKYANTTSE